MYVEKYAGFWKRFVAQIIDQIILGILHTIFLVPVYIFSFIEFLHPEEWKKKVDYAALQYDNYGRIPLETLVSTFLFISLIAILVDWLYYALMESSFKQATIGKMVLNIKVTDGEGNRITFGRATGRYFGKILSAMIFMIGYIMAGFTSKKQALHDLLADCLVVNSFYDKINNMIYMNNTSGSSNISE